MNTKQFLEKVFNRWPIKIICFVLAILVYFFHQISVLDTKTFTVPVEIQALGSMLPAETQERSVRVTIRGKSEELNEIIESDLHAYLDITNITKEGNANVPVIINTSQRMTVIDPLEITVKPEKIKIEVQQRTERFVPINPLVAGECEYGYEVKSITISPDSILISGPRDMVESIQSINTEKVDVSKAVKSFEVEVLPRNLNRLISLENYDVAKVSVEVDEIESSKQINALPVNCINVNENFTVQKSVEYADIELAGTVLDLDDLKTSSIFVTADCSEITEPGEYELPVNIRVPYYFTITSQEPKTVDVKVSIKPVEEITAETETVSEENVQKEISQ